MHSSQAGGRAAPGRKAFADRPKDWLDIDGIIIRQAPRLDWAYVRSQLAPLAELKEATELVDKLDRLRIDLEA